MKHIESPPGTDISTIFAAYPISGDILYSLVEIWTWNTSTKRRLVWAPFDKISKSGDGGRSGGISDTLTTSIKIQAKDHDVGNK